MPVTTSTKQKSIFPLLWVMIFDHTSLTITFPLLTLLFFDAQSSLFAPDVSHSVRSLWYGLCVAVPHVINIVMAPVLSALSDEFGRKKILLLATFGAFLFAFTAAVGIVTGMLSLLFMARIIQGIFSRSNPIAQAAIGDISTTANKVRNMGYLQFSISIGAFIGPLIGGYFANQFFFAQLNFSLPYFIAALLAAVSCGLTWFSFEETLVIHHKTRIMQLHWQTFKKVAANKDVLRISAILLLSQISWSMYYQFMPPILKTSLGFDAYALGIFVGLIALWLALATGFGIRFLEKFISFKRMLICSLYCVLVGLLCSIIFTNFKLYGYGLLAVWCAAIPIAVGDVITYSCLTSLYSNAVEKSEQGKVMGVCFIVVGLIWSMTGLLGGFLMSYTELLPLYVAPLGIIAALILMHNDFGKKIIF
jgi:MFS transporter, DHA1 family, tetracycline resistance protein